MKAYYLGGLLALAHLPLGAESIATGPTKTISTARNNVEIFRKTRLPAGTEIQLEMLQTVTSEDGAWKKGDEFSLAVAEDVCLDQYMIIPKGTQATGRIRRVSGRGVFGKSGKIEVEIDRLNLGGRTIPLSGAYRQSGEAGLTNAATIVAAGPFALFITGTSGSIVKGTVLTAQLAQDIPVVSPYKGKAMEAAADETWAVRARLITVADAFDAAWRQSPQIGNTAPPARPTVAEAFKDDLAALRSKP